MSRQVPLAWVLLPERIVGVIAIGLPLASRRGLRLTPRAAPFVLTSGICEVLGFGLFTIGARHNIAITAVLSSQFSAVAAVAGYLLLANDSPVANASASARWSAVWRCSARCAAKAKARYG